MTLRASGALLVALVVAGTSACGERVPAGAEPPPASRSDAADDAAGREILDRIVRAETTLAFHGLRTVSRGPEGASRETRLEIVRLADGRTWMEWSSGDGGAPRRRWTTASRFSWLARPELLARNYRVEADAAPSPPVAWRETRRVRIQPRRAGRPSLELLVDAETWLVLAETGRDVAGAAYLHGRFETLAYGAPERTPTDQAGDGPEDLDASAAGSVPSGAFRHLEAGVLPEGFVSFGLRRSSCGSRVEDFGDGLAAFSVLQKPAEGDAPAEEVRRSRCLGGLSLARRVAGIDVTVSGSLPEDELLRVLQGLRAPAPER